MFYPNHDAQSFEMKVHPEPNGVEMALSEHDMITLTPPREGFEIETIEGKVWLTQSGDPMDHVLVPSQVFESHSQGTVVVEGLTPAVFRIRKPKSA